MAIKINLDIILKQKGMTSTELCKLVGITNANLSILKTGKARAVRFGTLEKLCEVLECQPGDILEYIKGDNHGR
jgi:putative transcriptional regulator